MKKSIFYIIKYFLKKSITGNKIMKRFVFIIIPMFFIVNLCNSSVNSNGILILNDGREYKGKLVKIEGDTIVFEIDGKNSSFERKLVNKINFERTRLYDQIKNISEIKDRDIIDVFEESKKWKTSQEYNSVTILDKVTYDINKDFSVKINIKKALKILNDDGKDLSTQYFYYMKNYYKASLLYAITVEPDGGIFSIDEQALNDEPINNLRTYYDKLNRVKFGLKNTDVGSVIIWEAEINGNYSDLDNQFFVGKNLIDDKPVSKRIIEVSVPSELQINHEITKGLLAVKKPGVTVTNKGDKTTYTYSETNIKEYYNDEDNIPSTAVIYPFLYFSMNTGWDKITGDFYKSYFSASVPKKIADLTKKIAGSEKDKTRIANKIYGYINRQIESENLDFSETGYVPSDEDSIPDFTSLNLLDKSYLFVRMCKTLGIDTSMIFYRENSKGVLIDSCPALKQFDSVICRIQDTYYSFENQDFGVSDRNGMSSGASAIDVTRPGTKPFELKEISPFDNTVNVSYKCELKKNDTLVINRVTEITGSFRASWRQIRLMSKDELDKWERSRINRLGKDVGIISYKFVNDLDDYDKSVVFEEKLKINNFSFSSGKNLKLFRLPEIDFKAGSVAKTDREFPFYTGTASKNSYEFHFKLPAGYSVSQRPKDLDISEPFMKFMVKCNESKGSLDIRIESVTNKSFVDRNDYAKLKDLYEARAKFSPEWFILKAGK